MNDFKMIVTQKNGKNVVVQIENMETYRHILFWWGRAKEDFILPYSKEYPREYPLRNFTTRETFPYFLARYYKLIPSAVKVCFNVYRYKN